jgi:enoyl-CoA hydratase/3-hydroxyacyl-CoA dehydrogenase
MSEPRSPITTGAVIGAGTMGSAIALKIATEGYPVVVVDTDGAALAGGIARAARELDRAVGRGLLPGSERAAILARVTPTTDLGRARDADLVVEAVFENRDVKRSLLRELDRVLRHDAIVATNTSSIPISELAVATSRPERLIGLHYFLPANKNRLVEVIPGRRTSAEVRDLAWEFQEILGKIPIHSADSPGFVVNRYLVPMLAEAVRILDEGLTGIATIDAAAREAFGVEMGPFALMNATGIPVVLHAATVLGERWGTFYPPCDRLAAQVRAGEPWRLEGEADPAHLRPVRDRLLGLVFLVASAIVDEGVGAVADVDIGARVGLAWRRGPFALMNDLGMPDAVALAATFAEAWGLEPPDLLRGRAESRKPFIPRAVRRRIAEGVATITLNRPDYLNAITDAAIGEMDEAFDEALANPSVKGIVFGGAGKAFSSGGDLSFFARQLAAGRIDRALEFVRELQDLYRRIDGSPKTVVACLDGLALGAGAELALACDYIVMSPRAGIGFPETGIGLFPLFGGTQRLPRRVGAGLAKYLVLSGIPAGGDLAMRIGLADALVPADRVRRAAASWAVEKLPITVRAAFEPDAALAWDLAALAECFDRHRVEEILRGSADAGGGRWLADATAAIQRKAPHALRISEALIDESRRLPLRGRRDAVRAVFDDVPAEIVALPDRHRRAGTVREAAGLQLGQSFAILDDGLDLCGRVASVLQRFAEDAVWMGGGVPDHDRPDEVWIVAEGRGDEKRTDLNVHRRGRISPRLAVDIVEAGVKEVVAAARERSKGPRGWSAARADPQSAAVNMVHSATFFIAHPRKCWVDGWDATAAWRCGRGGLPFDPEREMRRENPADLVEVAADREGGAEGGERPNFGGRAFVQVGPG